MVLAKILQILKMLSGNSQKFDHPPPCQAWVFLVFYLPVHTRDLAVPLWNDLATSTSVSSGVAPFGIIPQLIAVLIHWPRGSDEEKAALDTTPSFPFKTKRGIRGILVFLLIISELLFI